MMMKMFQAVVNLSATALVGLAAVFGVLIYMRGQQNGKAKTMARIEQQELRGAAAARSIRSAVRGHSAAAVDRRLHDEGWMR
jgi:negative regulator of sigma E activity